MHEFEAQIGISVVFFRGIAGNVRSRWVDVLESTDGGETIAVDDILGVLNQPAEAFSTFSKFLLSPLASGDIRANQCHPDNLPIALVRHDSGFIQRGIEPMRTHPKNLVGVGLPCLEDPFQGFPHPLTMFGRNIVKDVLPDRLFHRCT